MSDHLEVFVIHEVKDISLLAGEEIVQTDDIMPVIQQSFAEVRSQKSAATRYKNSLFVIVAEHDESPQYGTVQDQVEIENRDGKQETIDSIQDAAVSWKDPPGVFYAVGPL